MESMMKICEFLNTASGDGSGDAAGDGFGDGSGVGSGIVSGVGSYHASGVGSGIVSGVGSYHASGDGSGFASGFGSYHASGFGHGSKDGIAAIDGDRVFVVDGIQTLVDRIRGNVAKGRILMDDLTTKACYIVKNGSLFAHGYTLREAVNALNDKLFNHMPENERIEAFVNAHKNGKAYPNTDFFDWHHKLTGSCEAGRRAFAENHGVDMDGSMTVLEFINLTEHDYGGATIQKLREYYEQEDENAGSGGDRGRVC